MIYFKKKNRIFILGLVLFFSVLLTAKAHPADEEMAGEKLPNATKEKMESPSRISDKKIPLQKNLVPNRPKPLIEIGEPFLKQGKLGQGFEIPTGAVWKPSFMLFGTVRTAIQTFDDGTTRFSEWANRVDIFANLALSGTERIFVGFRPVDTKRRYSGYQFGPKATKGFEEEFDGHFEALFFEGELGELFPKLDDNDRRSLDFGFSVGRQAFLIQDGMLIQDVLDAVGVTRNNLQFPNMSNFRLTGIFAWDEINRDDNIEDNSANLFGLFAEADFRYSTVALDFAYVDADKIHGRGFYAGTSGVQRIGSINTTFRVNTSFALDQETIETTNGTLLFGEFSYTPHGTSDLVYLNAFWGIDHFSSAARDVEAGGPLGRAGILFDAAGIGRYGSALSSNADKAYGGAIGWQVLLGSPRTQLIIELGGRIDRQTNDRASGAVGGRFQHALGQRVVLQLDGFASFQENRDAGYSGRAEILIKL